MTGMTNRRRATRAVTISITLAAVAMAAFGCGQRFDRIGDLNGNPDRYLHRTVVIAGNVTQVYGLPLGIANLAVYRLDDGTGRIWVVSHDGAPEDHNKVAVKGTLEPVDELRIGVLGNLFGNVVEEQQRRVE